MRGYVTLPIVIVLAAIAYIYCTTVFVVIDGWLGLLRTGYRGPRESHPRDQKEGRRFEILPEVFTL